VEIMELTAAVRARLAGALIALDFDGTLAPIVCDPADSRPLLGAIDALRTLAERGARLAVITGREARTVVRLGGLDAVPGLTVAGLYGAERWTAGELSSPDTPAAIGSLRIRLPLLLADVRADPALWIEDKRLSLVLHARRTADPDAALRRLRTPLTRLAADLGLQIHSGRGVLEFRLPGFDKGSTLRGLVEIQQPTMVLFVGDDVGDLPAFTEIKSLQGVGIPAWSVGVTSVEVRGLTDVTDLAVDGPQGVLELLQALAA
jgi:trehalose 6-phosphate phosphatase